MRHHRRMAETSRWQNRNLLLIGLASLLWFLFRTGTKPSRIMYPCQQAALAEISVLWCSLPISLTTVLLETKEFLSKKGLALAVLIIVAVAAVGNEQLRGSSQLAIDSTQRVQLTFQQREASLLPASDIYVVSGQAHAHVNELVQLMSSHGLVFYRSSDRGANQGPEGLFSLDDVVLIKINEEWDQRGGTNTDVIKELIQTIVDHPDGFTGEIVVADNGQWRGSMDWAQNNAEDHGQSTQDVVNMFTPTYRVSTFDWMPISGSQVSEFSTGDTNDGYILYDTADPVTGLFASYPKFTTLYGTRISFKHGVWNGTAYESRLKVINLPVLKSHHMLGVTECVKHYMGVQSESKFSPGLANGHDTVKYGGMGTLMAEVGLPTLNIVDAIWVNAHPESGLMGPDTPYSSATRVNVLAASTDPVALSYWSAKHVLMPAAYALGYSDARTLDPDDTDLSAQRALCPSLEQAFGLWLPLAMNQLVNMGYNVTNDESQMNVYSLSEPIHDIAVTSVTLSKAVLAEGQSSNISVVFENQGDFSETINLTIQANTTVIQTVFTALTNKTSNVTTFLWNSSGWARGKYTISVYATPVPNETYTSDNTLIDGTVTITIAGDVDGDTDVDIFDIVMISGSYNTRRGDEKYIAECDLDGDHDVDIYDVVIAAGNFGKS